MRRPDDTFLMLNSVRSATGATLQEIADLAGLSLGAVWRFERGMRPSAASAEKLLRASHLALERSKAAIAEVEARLAQERP
jgi:transcriptional regulator with XRE-family HTH domain